MLPILKKSTNGNLLIISKATKPAKKSQQSATSLMHTGDVAGRFSIFKSKKSS